MVYKQKGGRWILCPTCQQIMFTASRAKHKCPVKVLAMIQEDIQEWVEFEMSEFDSESKKFWKSKDVKFWKYLAEEGEL